MLTSLLSLYVVFLIFTRLREKSQRESTTLERCSLSLWIKLVLSSLKNFLCRESWSEASLRFGSSFETTTFNSPFLLSCHFVLTGFDACYRLHSPLRSSKPWQWWHLPRRTSRFRISCFVFFDDSLLIIDAWIRQSRIDFNRRSGCVQW